MQERAARWFRSRSSTWRDWPLDGLLAAKLRQGSSISLVIPARDEADTLPAIVTDPSPGTDEGRAIARRDRRDRLGLGRRDRGSRRAGGSHGIPGQGDRKRVREREGKGEALWKSLFVVTGDVLVFVDGDLTRWGPHFVTGLLGPLLAGTGGASGSRGLCRLRTHADGTVTAGGGRLTELVARPLINLHWPELGGVAQPLAGEWAARRSLMESLSFPVGYGIELSTLIDTTSRHGLDAVAQVQLGERAHRHRSDADMALAAAELLAVAESRRARVDVAALGPVELPLFVETPDGWASRSPGPLPWTNGRRLRTSPTPRTRAAESPNPSAPQRDWLSVSMPRVLRIGRRIFEPHERLVMAIVNRTPDSFFDRGATWAEDAAMQRVHAVVEAGVEIVDVGGVPARQDPLWILPRNCAGRCPSWPLSGLRIQTS